MDKRADAIGADGGGSTFYSRTKQDTVTMFGVVVGACTLAILASGVVLSLLGLCCLAPCVAVGMLPCWRKRLVESECAFGRSRLDPAVTSAR